jgi:hypothetical protein
MLQSGSAQRRDEGVICIYTRDCTDETDVRRVGENLRKLGFTGRMRYKPDESTRAGR